MTTTYYCLLLESTLDAQGRTIYRLANCQPTLDVAAICAPPTQQISVYDCQVVAQCPNGKSIVRCQIGD